MRLDEARLSDVAKIGVSASGANLFKNIQYPSKLIGLIKITLEDSHERGDLMSQPLKDREQFEHLVKTHPCFNSEAHYQYGRIHLPVSPDCNIQCRFCKRGFNKRENRPGVSRRLLTPAEAVGKVAAAVKLCPEITVVGIAGPGDTLASDAALEVFEMIHQKFPHLINCLSTNGLLLAEKADRIIAAGVKTVTVTVNAVDHEVLTNICSSVRYHDQYLSGSQAARLLIAAQLAGIRQITSLGAVVKINTVLIPGINDGHVGQIAEATAAMGASLINIIPLIPQHELRGYPAPDCRQLNAAREAAEKYLTVFRHCRHCRADACGIPGKVLDFAEQLYDQPLNTFSHG